MTSTSPTANELSPYKDLKGQVTKADVYFAWGAYSDVYKGEWNDPSTGKVVPVAVKFLRGAHTTQLLEKVKRYLNRETRVWHALSHPNVVPFLGVCSDIGPSPAMISPLYNNGHVCAYLNTHKNKDPQAFVIGVARGLKYLHLSSVIHGDIKGNNILVDDDGSPRLCDFGRSKLADIRGFTASTFAGCIRYLAPELLTTENDDTPILTYETDVYAFSMVSLEILSGREPFFNVSRETVITYKVQNGHRPERSKYRQGTFTDPMWELLVKCWDQAPAQRPTMESVVESLERPM